MNPSNKTLSTPHSDRRHRHSHKWGHVARGCTVAIDLALPFAQAFLAEMRKGAKRDVRQPMSGVQGGVMGLTKGEQRPQIDDGLATADTVALAP